MLDFRSDNTHGVSPEVLDALARANGGSVTSYGGDAITARLRERVRELFETDCEIYPLLTGTAGNSLAIASMTKPGETVLCHADAHIVRDEDGAPEFFSRGAKLVPIAGARGKLHPDDLIPARCLSLTNATEAGTVYTPDELRALTARGDYRVHLDGARFANALAALRCSPADLTWRSGIDLLVLGGTKNGLLAAELLVVFRKDFDLTTRIHRSGHRVSKMRFVSAQLDAYLSDDLWLRNARRANAAAARIADGIRDVVELVQPVEANVLFVRLPQKPEGVLLYDWPIYGENIYRLVTGWSTSDADVDALIGELTRSASGGAARPPALRA
jgi:threonine aldolase